MNAYSCPHEHAARYICRFTYFVSVWRITPKFKLLATGCSHHRLNTCLETRSAAVAERPRDASCH